MVKFKGEEGLDYGGVARLVFFIGFSVSLLYAALLLITFFEFRKRRADLLEML